MLHTFRSLTLTVCMVVTTFFVTAQQDSQSSDQDDQALVFQELIFDIGMNLVYQDTVVDRATMKDALAHLYQNVYEVMQIVDMYMMIDEEFIAQNITTLDQLIDYELDGDEQLAQAAIAWLSAYQTLFIMFTAIHQEDCSFEAWCNDMAFLASLADDEQPEDVEYVMLWLAASEFYDAQIDLEYALKDLE